MTKKSMYFKMVLNSLLRRRSRMIIALLSITIGAMIMSGLVTIYYDIPKQLGKEFRSYGANLIILPIHDRVHNEDNTNSDNNTNNKENKTENENIKENIKEKIEEKISEEQIKKLKDILPHSKIVGLAPYRYQTTKINEQPYMLAGTDLKEAKKNSPFWYIDGEWVENEDKDQALIGKEVARTLNLGIGDSFTVQGVKYGYQSETSTQTDTAEENKEKRFGDKYYDKKLYVKGIVTTGGAEEAFIFLNIDLLNEIIDDQYGVDVIEASIEGNNEELNQLSEKIHSILPQLTARPVKRVTQSQDTVLTKLQALVYLVNIVILILTMISVSTTMMTVVSERRKEIALKKALGAKNESIILEFLGEGIFLGGFGGLLGVILGFFFAQKVSLSVFGRAITFQWLLIPGTVFCFILITIVACLIPVRSTVYVEPAIVLRGE